MKRAMKKPGTFGWHCCYNNGKGGYDPDYEGCSAGRSGYKTALAAALAAQRHVQGHTWSRWGYPRDSNWRDHYVSVHEYLPCRKNAREGQKNQVSWLCC